MEPRGSNVMSILIEMDSNATKTHILIQSTYNKNDINLFTELNVCCNRKDLGTLSNLILSTFLNDVVSHCYTTIIWPFRLLL